MCCKSRRFGRRRAPVPKLGRKPRIALSQRPLLERYDLKKREYLCTTSMTAELSFLVANFAHCRPGTLVLDPFCGSASLLISAAHFGSYTMGGDIDIRVIRGKQKDKKMAAHCRFARTLKEVEKQIKELTDVRCSCTPQAACAQDISAEEWIHVCEGFIKRFTLVRHICLLEKYGKGWNKEGYN